MKPLQYNILYIFLLMCPLSLEAQTSELKGQITAEETGNPVPGVNVIIEHTPSDQWHGTATDVEGSYHIKELSSGTYSVKITAIGYQTVEKTIQLRTNQTKTANFTLTPATYRLNEIVVDAGYTGYSPNSPTTIQRIGAAAIQRQDVATTAEVARLLPASYVGTNSRGQTILYLRNSVDRQTSQFFNGALINVPWDNRVDLSFLPSAMLGGVTVSKGVPSIVYGTNTIGGAINFRANTLFSEGRVTEITAAAGLPSSGRASLLHMANTGAFSYTAEIGYSKRGDFALPADANLPYSQPSDETRVNTDRRLFNLFFQGNYQFDNGTHLSTSFLHVDAEKGIAPESNLDPQKTGIRYWRYPTIQQTMFIVNGEVPLGKKTKLYGSTWINRFTQDIYQYQTVAYEQLDATQNDLDYTGGLRLIFEQKMGAGTLDIALNALTTTHSQTNVPYLSGSAGTDSTLFFRQHIYSIGAEYSHPVSNKLTGMISVSYSGSAIVNTGPWEQVGYDSYIKSSFGLAAGFTYDLSNRVVLHAVAGKRPRFPTMRELYGGALGKFVPNPDLKPITAYMGELGIEWFGSKLSGSVTGFFNRFTNTIDKTTFQQGPNAGKEQRINLDGSRVLGVEVVAAARPTRNLRIDGSITWMQIRGLLNGELRKLDEKPAWLGSITLTYDLPANFELLLQSEYMAGVYTRTEQNTFVTLPNALIFDARLSYNLFSGGELFMRANNITDELRLLQLGLPSPGRSFLGGLKFSF